MGSILPVDVSHPEITCTDDQRMAWFQNLPGDQPFGEIQPHTCTVEPNDDLHALDYSLQLAVAFRTQLSSGNANPCIAAESGALEAPSDDSDEEATIDLGFVRARRYSR